MSNVSSLWGEKHRNHTLNAFANFSLSPGGLTLTFTWVQNYTPAAIKKHEKLY